MLRDEILITIHFAHFYNSAFSRAQVHRLMRWQVDGALFDAEVEQLLAAGVIRQEYGMLFARELQVQSLKKQAWSRQLFQDNRRWLHWLLRMPWVRYAALTGANSFESCRRKDDIDLFVVTSPDRLWLCYLLLVILCKCSGKRTTFCLNYLLDEANLPIRRGDYFTAVQLVQMIPLLRSDIAQTILRENSWIARYLPNAVLQPQECAFYQLGQPGRGFRWHFSLLTVLNRLVYRLYKRRLQHRFPQEMGRGIYLDEGIAQLNRVDHSGSYEQIHLQLQEELPS